MSEFSDEFLQLLDKQSREKQESFMKNISDRLGRERPKEAPEHPFKGAPDFWAAYSLSTEERVELFMNNWKDVGGHAQRFSDMSSVKEFIIHKSQEMKARSFIRQDQQELNELKLEEALLGECEFTVWDAMERMDMLASAAEADIGLVVADYAVSYTGSLVVTSGEDRGRSVSLLPTACMYIVPVERLKTRLGEVMKEIHQIGFDSMPAGTHFISGPSRSADIENDLTIGVHGPGIVYALLVG